MATEKKVLPPIRLPQSDFDELEERIAKLFREEIFAPLLRIVGAKPSTLQNSLEDVVSAVRADRIRFNQGQFTGNFNASLSRELKRLGATWDRRNSSWRINAANLPRDVRDAIDASLVKFQKTLDRIDDRIRQIMPEQVAEKLSAHSFFDSTLHKVNTKIQDQLESITVAPQMTAERRKLIAAEYTKDLKRYVADWTAKQMVKLRSEVKDSAMKGLRHEGLAEKIQQGYDVSLSKAKFLARQETHLMLSKYNEARYSESGVNEYTWGCVIGSPAHPVRPMHKALEGKTFRWDTPPITNVEGKRNNPGQDYNCRCYPRPVVNLKKIVAKK